MKYSIAALSLATLSLAMLTPAFAQSAQDNQPDGTQQAQRMVPAVAALSQRLDATTAQPGSQFRATISSNVHLNGGVELHHGDVLLGQVTTDDMNTVGKSRLAVRFTQAVLKNGQTIPVKATIVSFYQPSTLLSDQYAGTEEVPNDWNNGTLSVDQIGVVKNVDLHSSISSSNSGVFVSTKDDVKLPAGSEIALAIAPAQTNSTNTGD
jgi:hypothetical protein